MVQRYCTVLPVLDLQYLLLENYYLVHFNLLSIVTAHVLFQLA
jgi:hypothetical protein